MKPVCSSLICYNFYLLVFLAIIFTLQFLHLQHKAVILPLSSLGLFLDNFQIVNGLIFSGPAFSQFGLQPLDLLLQLTGIITPELPLDFFLSSFIKDSAIAEAPLACFSKAWHL